jgi:pimeloyl-ACP methyl ester carboxylesterase
MPEVEANGVRLYYELHGEGDPVVLVHGSWDDASVWQLALPGLADSFRVLVYDRRGHSRSERPDAQGSVDEHGDDLAALMAATDFEPAHVMTNSYGGNIALRLAIRRPEIFRSLCCHEPPLFGLLEGDPEAQELLQQSAGSFKAIGTRIAAGDHEGAARQFIDEVALGPGAWENELPPEARANLVRNAPTFLDELNDPDAMRIGEAALARLSVPVHLTGGTESPPTFGRVIEQLVEVIPAASREVIAGGGHEPHASMPDRYVAVATDAIRRATS